jgi:hypothetical protein
LPFRYERKYILDAKTAGVIKARVSGVLLPDAHSSGPYRVNNLYFDDMYRSAYQAKQTGALIRDKYRIRYYNDDLAFIRLEHKHKEGERSAKRSAVITQEEFTELADGGLPAMFTQDAPLLRHFSRLYTLKRLRPVVAFSYIREAFTHKTGNVRLTLDSRVPGGYGVLELKYSHFLPCFVSELLTGLPLSQVEASKYNKALEAYPYMHSLSHNRCYFSGVK